MADRPPLFDGAKPLKVFSWNIQFAGSTRLHFFYDGGSAVSVPRPVMDASIDAIAAAIAVEDPDVVMLQEVDRGASRTERADQHAALLSRLPLMRADASCWYWWCPYVPHPPHEHLGRVEMHLTVLSKFRLGASRRVPLPLLASDSWLKGLFNVRRAVQVVELPCQDGRVITLMNTHLSAFSNGDGTLLSQVQVLRQLGGEARRWILAGDFNSLPPGVDPKAVLEPEEASFYQEAATPVLPLFEEGLCALPREQLADTRTASRWYTYKPFHKQAGDRTLDYIFASKDEWRVMSAHVAQTPEWPSDHLPLVARLQLQ